MDGVQLPSSLPIHNASANFFGRTNSSSGKLTITIGQNLHKVEASFHGIIDYKDQESLLNFGSFLETINRPMNDPTLFVPSTIELTAFEAPEVVYTSGGGSCGTYTGKVIAQCSFTLKVPSLKMKRETLWEGNQLYKNYESLDQCVERFQKFARQ